MYGSQVTQTDILYPELEPIDLPRSRASHGQSIRAEIDVLTVTVVIRRFHSVAMFRQVLGGGKSGTPARKEAGLSDRVQPEIEPVVRVE